MMNLKKTFEFVEYRIDLGDIINAVLVVVGVVIATTIGVKQLNQASERQTEELKKIITESLVSANDISTIKVFLNEIQFFDNDESNFTVKRINTEKNEAYFSFNLRGTMNEEWIALGHQKIINLPSISAKYVMSIVKISGRGDWISVIFNKHLTKGEANEN